ncbi:hypothetical protein CEXT_277011 [Caerostris extrusa]|uniref:Uncharacterized protein n=1 Tax=Caerostris extrusa TaxID=172846 RepID=A0AAV4XU63_CAEEX|nr:hypothetical protein CEXT_277011 [Caerostris extrusa]
MYPQPSTSCEKHHRLITESITVFTFSWDWELEPARNSLEQPAQQTKAEDNEEISYGDKSLPQLSRAAAEISISPCAPPNCKCSFDGTQNDNPEPLDK